MAKNRKANPRKTLTDDQRRERAKDLADAMETPLADAARLVDALEFVGFGMHSHGDDAADAVLGLAVTLADTLAHVRKLRDRLFAAV